MNFWGALIIAFFAGAIIGYMQTFVFSKLPEKWLQDYGVKETDPDFRLSKRMQFFPHGFISAIFCVAIYMLFVGFGYSHWINPLGIFHLLTIALSTPIIVIVMMSDRLNRIIPDECSIALALIGVISLIGDFIEPNIWFTSEAEWYVPLLNRLLAALIGGGFLWLLNFICMTFLGKEGMGQGDMKLLAAVGLMTGCYGLLVVLYVGIIASMFFAVPLFIRKRIRIAREKKEIMNAENPFEKRAEIAARKAAIHFADDPDYLAFGPFLAFGTSVFLALEPVFFDYLHNYLVILGLSF
ncbi:MAG: A24 family peptidase [Saccharofermentans sp.]|nr:A24 family peptidase [Saccharofermentans sp.]